MRKGERLIAEYGPNLFRGCQVGYASGGHVHNHAAERGESTIVHLPGTDRVKGGPKFIQQAGSCRSGIGQGQLTLLRGEPASWGSRGHC
jgi:hypothetical protein